MIDVVEMAKALGMSEQTVAEVLDGQESPEEIARRLGCPINHGIALVTLRADRAVDAAEPEALAAVAVALDAGEDVTAWEDGAFPIGNDEQVVVVVEEAPVEVAPDPEPVAEPAPVEEAAVEEPVSDPAPAEPAPEAAAEPVADQGTTTSESL